MGRMIPILLAFSLLVGIGYVAVAQQPLAPSGDTYTDSSCNNWSDTFGPDANVYMKCDNCPDGYDAYVFESDICGTLEDGDPIPNTYETKYENINQGQCVLLWDGADTTPGLYDVVYDNDGDGTYDATDGCDHAFGSYEFEVTPEAATIALVLAGLGLVAIVSRHQK